MARSGDISYPPAASSESETEQFRQGDPDATARPQNPLDPLRKGNVVMELAGAGILCLGSDLLVCLYVTGPPRLSDYASASTGVLLLNLILGGVAAMPSWVAAVVLFCEGEQPPDRPPLHGRFLRICALLALLFATLYGFSGIVLFAILQSESSFVSFCLENLNSTDEVACTDRWNRAWVIIVVAAIVLLYHVAAGFPVYRYARGTQYGPQLEAGFLFEEGKQSEEYRDRAAEQRRRSRRSSRRSHGSSTTNGSRTARSLSKRRSRSRGTGSDSISSEDGLDRGRLLGRRSSAMG